MIATISQGRSVIPTLRCPRHARYAPVVRPLHDLYNVVSANVAPAHPLDRTTKSGSRRIGQPIPMFVATSALAVALVVAPTPAGASSEAEGSRKGECLIIDFKRPPSALGRQVAATRQRLAEVDAQIAAVEKAHYLDDSSGGVRGRKTLAKLLAPLKREQQALSEAYMDLLKQNKGLDGSTVTKSFDFSLLAVPGFFDLGVKVGGRISGKGTGRPLAQFAPEGIVDTAVGLYGNLTWDPDKKKITPSVTGGVGPVAVTSHNPLYGKRVQFILPGIVKFGMSRTCIGGSVKVGLPIGPRVGGTFYVEDPRVMPTTNWIFDHVGRTVNRIPGLKQGKYEIARGMTRTKAKVKTAARRLFNRARKALREL